MCLYCTSYTKQNIIILDINNVGENTRHFSGELNRQNREYTYEVNNHIECEFQPQTVNSDD